MKKRYQIAAGCAVHRVRQWAEERNPVVQLMLPTVEILALAERGAVGARGGAAVDPIGDPSGKPRR